MANAVGAPLYEWKPGPKWHPVLAPQTLAYKHIAHFIPRKSGVGFRRDQQGLPEARLCLCRDWTYNQGSAQSGLLPTFVTSTHTVRRAMIHLMTSPTSLVGEGVPARRRRRVQLITPVCVVVERSGTAMSVRAQLLDISDDGAAVLAGVDIPMGTYVQLEFGQIFEGRTLNIPAVVRNRRKYIYGVEFLPGIEGAEDQKLRTLKSTLFSMGNHASARLGDRRRA